jgi:putative membrane protein
LQRLLKRVAVLAVAAGGGEGEAAKQRQRLAPILRRDHLDAFLREIDPQIELAAVDWRGLPARAFRRVLRRNLWLTLAAAAGCMSFLGWRAGAAAALCLAPLAILQAWGSVRTERYGVTAEHVLVRKGWLWRRLGIAAHRNVQAVLLHESPFDRRHGMVSVHADTSGASEGGGAIAIPYLEAATGAELFHELAKRCASSSFRW